MDLDEVQTRLLAARGGGGEIADHLPDLIALERPVELRSHRGSALGARVGGQAGWRDQGPLAAFGAAGIPKLDAELGVVLMDSINQPL